VYVIAIMVHDAIAYAPYDLRIIQVDQSNICGLRVLRSFDTGIPQISLGTRNSRCYFFDGDKAFDSISLKLSRFEQSIACL